MVNSLPNLSRTPHSPHLFSEGQVQTFSFKQENHASPSRNQKRTNGHTFSQTRNLGKF